MSCAGLGRRVTEQSEDGRRLLLLLGEKAGMKENVQQTNQHRRCEISVARPARFSKAPSGARQQRHVPDVAPPELVIICGGCWCWFIEHVGAVSIQAGE